MSNEEVLHRANTYQQILDIIKQRKTSYLGHILLGFKYIFLKIILIKKIERKRELSYKQYSWLRNIRN